MKKVIVLVLAMMMVLAMVPTVAFAAEVKYITTSDQLADAIKHQGDGETWILAPNITFDLGLTQMEKYKKIEINDHTGFVFPITANGLTIKGGIGTVITSSAVVNTGAWNLQNFITIGGNNVTLDGLTLIANENEFYWDSNGANKVIEVLGKGSVIKNLKVEPRDGGDFSGSIYYSNSNLGSTDILENVTLSKGRISLTGKTNGVLNMKNVLIDFSAALLSAPSFTGFANPNDDVVVSPTNVTLMMSQSRIELLTDTPAGITCVAADAGTLVTAGVDPTYTIVIPATVNFGTLQKDVAVPDKAFNVKAQNVIIEADKEIVVSVDSNFKLSTSGGTPLDYELYNSSGKVVNNAPFATFTGDRIESGWVKVPSTAGISVAGIYQDTMTFTIAYQ
jgi:hypothetical protein